MWTLVAGQKRYFCTALLVRVIDGDTVRLDMDLGQHIHKTDNYRLLGIDTPEMSTDAGKEAKRALELLLDEWGGECETFKADKYGRYLVKLTLQDGRDVAETLIAMGHGVAYSGGAR